ncbi:ATP-binding protein [Massilia sp. IC2-476]|uniref:sensor histidine kinase n=1 Tax=Massilia sp. IC2-476 TaxID=2887199 RepID=UPI001D1142EB|nr:ATP-binding protein [Massilia sp. IC2-476]MCC2971501.1 PAS domain S-box protein [Massilia sp. IC2-476]
MSSSPDAAIPAAPHAYPELRFRELFEQAPVSLQILDPEGYTVQVNRAWEALWHIYEGSELKRYVLSREYNVLRDPQLVESGISAYLARALAGESVEVPAIHYDTAALGQPGRARWVTARAHPIKDGAGRVVEVMLMHEDISARVEAETALREREERFRTLAMATSQIVWTNTADGRVLEDSPSWRAFTGQSYEEWCGLGWQDALHPDDRARVAEIWAACVATHSVFETEYRLRRADGVYRWTAVKGIPILGPDGAVREWVGANRDIHDSVTQQEGLAERLGREQRQSALLAKVASAARTLHTALRSEDIADALAQEVGAILECAQVEVSLDAGDDCTPAGPGALAVPLVDRKGRRIGCIRVAGKHDGSFDEQDEAILVQLAAIAATGFANAQLYGSLREQDRRKDEFLAMLAHELRNPLAPIASAAEILRIAANPERIRASSEVITRQVRHMTSLVNDLLDVSRVTRGLIKLDRTLVGIESVVASAVEQSRPLVAARGHALSLEVAPELAGAQVEGDATRLVQVITNLLNNAAKYTPNSGTIDLRATRDGARVQLCVVDNGIGIDAALLPHVFDLFTQAERTPDRSQGGLGIGLALVRTMVALHGGEVQVHSEGSGKGCTFTVWLPLA